MSEAVELGGNGPGPWRALLLLSRLGQEAREWESEGKESEATRRRGGRRRPWQGSEAVEIGGSGHGGSTVVALALGAGRKGAGERGEGE